MTTPDPEKLAPPSENGPDGVVSLYVVAVMLSKVAPEVGTRFPGDRIVIDAAFPAATDNPKLTAAASSVEMRIGENP